MEQNLWAQYSIFGIVRLAFKREPWDPCLQGPSRFKGLGLEEQRFQGLGLSLLDGTLEHTTQDPKSQDPRIQTKTRVTYSGKLYDWYSHDCFLNTSNLVYRSLILIFKTVYLESRSMTESCRLSRRDRSRLTTHRASSVLPEPGTT